MRQNYACAFYMEYIYQLDDFKKIGYNRNCLFPLLWQQKGTVFLRQGEKVQNHSEKQSVTAIDSVYEDKCAKNRAEKRLHMNTRKIRNSCLLMLTALIWGVAFVAQSAGGDAVGPYMFNSIRSLIGAAVLVPVILVLDQLNITQRKPVTKEDKKTLLTGGIACGVALCLATNVQQLGIYLGASAGKAGFLTACYILLVPILGLFLKKKCGWNIWVGVVLTLAGLYLLCMQDSFTLELCDGLLLLCALCFAVQILFVDHFAPLVDGVRLSCIQFLVCGILSAVPALIFDLPGTGAEFMAWVQVFGSPDAWIPILYAGVMSCGVAYTLQIVGQNGLNPTVASLLMSLESVFAVLAGWLLLDESMGPRELAGCGLIFAAIVLAQVPIKKRI